jgi:hypothetical protein
VSKKLKQPRIVAIGIDLGDKWSHYCSIGEEGDVIVEGRVKMSRRAFSELFEDMPPTRIAIEAGSSRCGSTNILPTWDMKSWWRTYVNFGQ